MKEEEDEVSVYRKLQQNLDKLPISYPATESGVEIRILKHLFSPEWALIASKLGSKPITLKDIYSKVEKDGIPLEKVEKALDEMDTEGLIVRLVRKINDEDVKSYVSLPFMLGFYEFQMNKFTEEFIYDVDQYCEEAFIGELNKTKIPQLRTIPIESEIGVERNVATYDDFRYYLENCGEPQ